MCLKLFCIFPDSVVFQIIYNNKNGGYIMVNRRKNIIKEMFLHQNIFNNVKDILIKQLLKEIEKDTIKIRKNQKEWKTYRALGFKELNNYYLVFGGRMNDNN